MENGWYDKEYESCLKNGWDDLEDESCLNNGWDDLEDESCLKSADLEDESRLKIKNGWDDLEYESCLEIVCCRIWHFAGLGIHSLANSLLHSKLLLKKSNHKQLALVTL